MTHFADDLVGRCRRLGHPLCAGLDPHLDRIPELFRRGSMSPADPETAPAVEAFLTAVVDRLASKVPVIKPQAAFFELLGPAGMGVLARIVARARQADLPVLLDAKRGDIGSTATAYARAYLGPEATLRCDAITLNPYLGLDTLEPFLGPCEAHGSGVFVLVKTSNPGSGHLQDLRLQGPSGEPGLAVREALADALSARAEALRGPDTGWSSLGVVVGATYPGEAEALRQRLPHNLFLVPGYGAQGGSAVDAVRGFVAGPRGLEGGVVNSSRGILFPKDAHRADTQRWEQVFDDTLERAIDELTRAVSSSESP